MLRPDNPASSEFDVPPRMSSAEASFLLKGQQMLKKTYEPYRCYQTLPFTKEERDHVTILFGGLHWRAERVMQGNFERAGYKSQPLPPATRNDLEKGRELADIGQCCPTAFTTGNLTNFLTSEAERIGADAVARDYIYLTAGACGACRFGQYHQSYELALKNLGMETFRMFFMKQSRIEHDEQAGGGLEFTMPLLLGAAWGVMCADIIQDFEYQIRPYEVVPGSTNKAAKAAVEEIYQASLNCPVKGKKWGAVAWYLTTNYYANALRRARRHFEEVEVDRLRVKAKVKITGEFYLQTIEGEANYNIHSWLENEGAEVQPAMIVVWLDYLMTFAAQSLRERLGITPWARFGDTSLRALSWLYRRAYNKLRKAFLDIPYAPPRPKELRALSAPYFDQRMSGGEGDLLIGKTLWAHVNKKAHMVCELSPYACMPNTMSTGSMAMALGQYPDLLYAPLEIKGDSEVHALSRCQMILTEAKSRAQEEFDAALKKAGMTLDEARKQLDCHPELKKAFNLPKNHGVTGTAANMVLELGGH